jgi:lipooligosaccharide transport system ATP-binding protein
MDGGRIVAEGSPRSLIEQHSSREVAEIRFAPGENAAAVPGIEAALGSIDKRVEVLPDRVLLYVHDGEGAVNRIRDAGLEPVSTLVRRSTLEDVFLHLTGRSLVD